MPEKSKKEKTEKSSRNQSGKTGSRKRLRIRITRNRIIAGITVLLTGISALLVFSEIWAFTTWAGLKMDEILFHLRAPLEGTGGGMLAKYATRCILPAVLIMVSVFIMIVHTRNISKTRTTFVRRSFIGAGIALVLSLIGADPDVVREIAQDLCVFFHQESVLVTTGQVEAYSVTGNL